MEYLCSSFGKVFFFDRVREDEEVQRLNHSTLHSAVQYAKRMPVEHIIHFSRIYHHTKPLNSVLRGESVNSTSGVHTLLIWCNYGTD
jgi:hypothetical protein